MYLSKLTLNLSSLETRRLLLSPYLLHKAIFRAFPDANGGGPGRILYRLDEIKKDNGSHTYLLVQSEKEPQWEKAELLVSCLYYYESKPLNLEFIPGQVFYFRLRANPTVKRNGKRLGLLNEEVQLDWLKRKAQDAGFTILSCSVIPEGMVKDDKRKDADTIFKMTILSVRFEGKLKVTAPQLFGKALELGVGSAKGLGFGLLSVAPVRN